MSGGSKPLYLLLGRKGPTLLPPPSAHRTLQMDGRSHGRTRRKKAILATNPVLAAPNIGEPMLLYIAATHQVVSAVLVVEREADEHKFPL